MTPEQRLTAAIDALPAELRPAVRVVYVEDRTFIDAAKVLGCSVGTAHNRCVRGLKQLRRIMGVAAA